MTKTHLPEFTSEKSLDSYSNSIYSDKHQQLDELAIYPMFYMCDYCPREVNYPCGTYNDGTTMICTKLVYSPCNCRYVQKDLV